jgi:4-amino-4-deoxy-L-arabinose transferase-like glycosyltransferase
VPFAIALLFNTYALGQNGYANTFYSAAVRSALHSLHNFLFVSFDPGGLISVDKPPLAIWLQVASAKLFGFTPLALLAPEACAGALTALLLYFALRGPIGRFGALCAALALIPFPAFVAISRDNLPDPLMLLLLTGACALAIHACARARLAPLLASALLVGLAFNTKTLAAYIPLPALALAYLICAPSPLRTRLLKLAAAGLVLAAVSLAWLSFVDLTPAHERPYVGGSLDNSELGLTFDYNGFGRIAGQEGGPGQIPYRPGAATITLREAPTHPPALAIYRALDATQTVAIRSEPGAPGPLRLFDRQLGGQDGWLLAPALLALLALAYEWLARAQSGRRHRAHADEPGATTRLAAMIVFSGWFVTEALILSLAKGIVHPYYTSALAVPAAALIGIGAERALAHRHERGASLLVALALAVSVAVQGYLLARSDYLPWLIAPVALTGALLPALALPGLLRRPGASLSARARSNSTAARSQRSALRARLRARLLLGALICTLLVAPASYAATTWLAPVQGTFPAAGPHAAAGAGGIGLEGEDLKLYPRLARFIRAHAPDERFSLLTVSSVAAAPLILMGIHAAALAGYGGTDPALGARALARLVASGQARYVLLGGPYSERGGNRATQAVLAACRLLPQRAWGGAPLTPYSFTLYDCAGDAARLPAR